MKNTVVSLITMLLASSAMAAMPDNDNAWAIPSDAIESRSKSRPELERLPCSAEATLRSTSGEVPALVRFRNQRKETIELFWLDYQGKRKSYITIAAGDTYEQQTYLTHPWLIATLSGACLEIRVPRAARYGVTIK